jgi:hypothetical protein
MNPLRREQAKQMLVLQGQMNATVNEQWLAAGYPFLRAVVVEVGEALEHLGWKWWKTQTPDEAQASIELIDILHFMLSHELVQAQGDVELAADRLVAASQPQQASVQLDGKTYQLDDDPRFLLELLAGLASVRRSELCVLEACFRAMNLIWDQVYVQYVSKNVLNIFRQEHGYKDGSYVKEWFGQEDNVHLVEIAASLDPTSATYSADLKRQLAHRYQAAHSALAKE